MKHLLFILVSLTILTTGCVNKTQPQVQKTQNNTNPPPQPIQEEVLLSNTPKSPLNTTHTNTRHGFTFKYSNEWSATTESCNTYQKECDTFEYRFGQEDRENMGVLITGGQVTVLPTNDTQEITNFIQTKLFDGKWFRFVKEEPGSQTYAFTGSEEEFEFKVSYVVEAEQSFIISPILDNSAAQFDNILYTQMLTSFKLTK